jgi:hypothetical protein
LGQTAVAIHALSAARRSPGTRLLMAQVLAWLKDEKNFAVVAMIGGGLAAAVGGGWTVATFVTDHQKDKPSPSFSIVVEQKGIGIASGHDTTTNAPATINSNAKDITAPILEQIEKLDGRQKETAAQIARKKGIEIPPLLAVLVKMGEKDPKAARRQGQ